MPKTNTNTPQKDALPLEENLENQANAGNETAGIGNAEDKAAQEAANKHYSLYRFLQMKMQQSGVKDLLIAKFSMKVKTIAEWETIVSEILHRNVGGK